MPASGIRTAKHPKGSSKRSGRSAPDARAAEVRWIASDALGWMGSAAAPHAASLAALLRDAEPRCRRAGLDALGMLGPAAREQAPKVEALLADEDPACQVTAGNPRDHFKDSLTLVTLLSIVETLLLKGLWDSLRSV